MLSPSFIGPLEVAKVLFSVLYVLATVGVIVGVYWEGERFPKEKQHRGWRLLVASLASDTLLTVLIFSTDGWISAIQRGQIATATQSAAAATQAAAAAELELAKLESPRTLTPEQQAKVIAILKTAPKGAVAVATPFTDSTDAKAFSESVIDTLQKSGFTIVPPPKPFAGILSFDTPGAWLVVRDLQHSTPYAPAIQKAFGAVGVYFPGAAKPDALDDPNQVVIVISSHPFKPEPVPAGLVEQVH